MKTSAQFILFIFLSYTVAGHAQQKCYNQWFFGTHAGLNFNTSPPGILTNGSLETWEGCASISDNNGNLLFYTDGTTLYNKTHAVMNNGTNLASHFTSSQAAVIVRKPFSNNLYYVFTQSGPTTGTNSSLSFPPGLCYTIVDMALDAGKGAVTTKNLILTKRCTEKLTFTKHCNGVDYWIITHGYNSREFKSFLLDSSGIHKTPVISAVGSVLDSIPRNAYIGMIKIGAGGKKLISTTSPAIGATADTICELFDFDNSTGLVFNPVHLPLNHVAAYGCEFSPDGSKVYVSANEGAVNGQQYIYQWDICTATGTQVLSTMYTVYSGTAPLSGMQCGPDGTIYISKNLSSSLAIIKNPNLAGVTCNFQDAAQSVAPSTARFALPAILYEAPLANVVVSLACGMASFTAPLAPEFNIGCPQFTHTISTRSWDFGDPVSSANKSTLMYPTHAYRSDGTYTVTLISHYTCGRANDTSFLTVNIQGLPSFVSGTTFTACPYQAVTFSASGADNYFWSTGSTSSTTSVSNPVTKEYTVTTTSSVNGCSSFRTYTLEVVECAGISESSQPLNLLLFPNPASQELTATSDESLHFQLIDQLGVSIQEGQLPMGKSSIDISSLPPGVYFFKACNSNRCVYKRFYKLK